MEIQVYNMRSRGPQQICVVEEEALAHSLFNESAKAPQGSFGLVVSQPHIQILRDDPGDQISGSIKHLRKVAGRELLRVS